MLRSITLKTLAVLLAGFWSLATYGPALADKDPHGLAPAHNMVFMPHLPGLRNKTFRDQYGNKKSLSEAVLLRGSRVQNGQAKVPAGGLLYISETAKDAQPLVRDPFLVLGEHAYLVDLDTRTQVFKDIKVKRGRKVLIGDTGYRLWFDYATDHYEKPYAEFALISPSGGWPLEFPISTVFPSRQGSRQLNIAKAGYNPQIKPFFLDREYFLGASRYKAKHIDFDSAEFAELQFPEISKATFSMTRPLVLNVRQEDFRFYFNKRIYALRRPGGILVRVTNFMGDKVLAEKLLKPVTAQGYQSRMDQKEKYHLTIPAEDMRVEIMVHPTFLKHSDFVPWSTGKSHGYKNGYLAFVVYRNLLTVEHGKPWPLDQRYKVLLEPNAKTGMLQRLVLENNKEITLSDQQPSYEGPIKWSHVWNRPAFTVTALDFDGKVVRSLYVRDYYFMRTDEMVFYPDEGRENIDFFVGSSPVLEPILEGTFLTRLADTSMGTVVEGSYFTSYPQVISNASFYEPDHTAPFVPRLKGLQRKIAHNNLKERLLSAESVFIRGSYVNYKNGKIIIPPAGLCYSSRNARNIRTLAGESFFMLGRQAYIASFRSTTYVLKNFDLDFWKNQPMDGCNLTYWQDELLGVRNKALRYTGHFYLDDRPVAELSLMKYSGNRWGAHFYLAQGLAKDAGNRYQMAEVFGEGATWIVPEYIGSNYVKIKEFGTPSIESISFTYKKPKKKVLGVGDSAKLGKYKLVVMAIDPKAMTVSTELRDSTGKVVTHKVFGPLMGDNLALMPQYQEAAKSLQLRYEDLQIEWDMRNPLKDGKANIWLFADLKDLKRDTPFEFDERFMVRPDVCGHCYQFNEILLDNPESIVLDMDHPVFEGPKGEDGKPLFKLVIDDFDGEMIHAWHIETVYRKKTYRTDNLAFRPRKNLDVLVGVTGTIEGFLRLSMLPRLGFMEYWRTGAKGPSTKMSGNVNTGGSAHIRR
jgi:hypothetical protein